MVWFSCLINKHLPLTLPFFWVVSGTCSFPCHSSQRWFWAGREGSCAMAWAASGAVAHSSHLLQRDWPCNAGHLHQTRTVRASAVCQSGQPGPLLHHTLLSHGRTVRPDGKGESGGILNGSQGSYPEPRGMGSLPILFLTENRKYNICIL